MGKALAAKIAAGTRAPLVTTAWTRSSTPSRRHTSNFPKTNGHQFLQKQLTWFLTAYRKIRECVLAPTRFWITPGLRITQSKFSLTLSDRSMNSQTKLLSQTPKGAPPKLGVFLNGVTWVHTVHVRGQISATTRFLLMLLQSSLNSPLA